MDSTGIPTYNRYTHFIGSMSFRLNNRMHAVLPKVPKLALRFRVTVTECKDLIDGGRRRNSHNIIHAGILTCLVLTRSTKYDGIRPKEPVWVP